MSGECVSSQPEPTGDPRAGGHAEGVRLQPELEDALRAEIAIGVLRGDALGGDVDGVTTFSTNLLKALESSKISQDGTRAPPCSSVRCFKTRSLPVQGQRA